MPDRRSRACRGVQSPSNTNKVFCAEEEKFERSLKEDEGEEAPIPPVDLGAEYRGIVSHVGQNNAFLKLPDVDGFEVMMPAAEFTLEEGGDLRERVLAEEEFACVVKKLPRKKGDKVCP
jgi:hypothetical protein